MACMEKPPYTGTFTMGSPQRHTDACRMHATTIFSVIGSYPGVQASTLLDTTRDTTLDTSTYHRQSSPSMSVTSPPETTDGHQSPPPARADPDPAPVLVPPATDHPPASASGSAGVDPPPETMHREPTPTDKTGCSDTESLPATNNDIPVQWRKRLVKSASINFHSIADLVKPCRAATPPESAGEGRLTVHVDGTYPSGTPTPSAHHQAHLSPYGEHGSNNRQTPPSNRSDEYINVVDGVEDEGAGTPGLRPTPRTAADLLSTQCRASGSRPSPPTPAATGSRSDRPADCGSPPGASAADTEVTDPSRLRKGRTIYKAQQVYVLEQVFSRTHYPDPEVIETLARELDISENKIKVWFQNKRARWRRRAAETGLPPQPIGFTLTGTPGGLSTSWPHSALPQGLIMPQPVYNSPYPGGQVVSPRPGFPTVSPYSGMSTPLYLDSAMMAAAKGLSPTVMPYGSYSMSVLPSHIWTETSKLHSGT